MNDEVETGRKILLAVAETDGVIVYCRTVAGQDFFRIDSIANAGFQNENELESRKAEPDRLTWSYNLAEVLQSIRMPWYMFSYFRISPSFADQILSVRNELCNERGGDLIDLNKKEQYYFRDYEL